jgi:hypothetical protein
MSLERHVLGLSGGRDSAALAVYMRQTHPEIPIEYFFTDTGKELPEVYEFLHRLEGFLGKRITYLNPDRDFDFWLKEYRNFLPSPRTRWCTRQLKIRPFEAWIGPTLKRGGRITSYVAIRSDEADRLGYQPSQRGVTVKMPFIEARIDKTRVIQILEEAGLGLPAYYRWRSRSGCTFCFFQQKIEWVRLLREHPDAFEAAKTYEKTALQHGSPFSWSQGETLEQLSHPERIKRIENEYEENLQRALRKRIPNALVDDLNIEDIDELYAEQEGGGACLVCYK